MNVISSSQFFLGATKVMYALCALTPVVGSIHSVRIKSTDVPAYGLTKMIGQSATVALAFSLLSKAFSFSSSGALIIGLNAGATVFCHLVKEYDQENEDIRKQDEFINKYPFLNKVIKNFSDFYFR